MPTLQIFDDGVLLREVALDDGDQEALDLALALNPPRHARGGVATVSTPTKWATVATSVHSTKGPRWALERNPTIHRRKTWDRLSQPKGTTP